MEKDLISVVFERCCGLDIHKKMIVACLLLRGANGHLKKETRTFSTMTTGLLELLDWLKGARCTHVAMESTGVFWKPIYNVLEGEMEVLLVNAQHIKAVPGRKTDVKDAEWIASLLQHGLLTASFIPPRPQRELRELTRTRKTLIEERARIVNRIQKVLEDANIKLSSVVTDITGKTARQILHAMLQGEQDLETLAGMARGKLRSKQLQLAQAVQGTLRAHHRFVLSQHLAHLDFLSQQIEAFDQQIAEQLGLGNGPEDPDPSPSSKQAAKEALQDAQSEEIVEEEEGQTRRLGEHRQDLRRAIERLDAITGISLRTAEVVVAEIGIQMDRFPTQEQLASWVGLCPGNKVSAGKRLSGKTTKGNRWLRTALIEAAQGAASSKGTFLGAYYRRLCQRMGRKKAIVAVAHRILLTIYHVLKEDEPFRELGEQYASEKERETTKRRALRRLEQLGYQVQLQQAETA
ncbi:IS110 family transposase [Dictyobacter arantiisoli]|uniref:IS110 family transposase n=1 Tax=Dictyobacter arantiisoli TaxID=2014874 RepID=A0A5A5TEW4_9CHLR|nr:IS110 family transposase [Dictyobacter arantiisoli]GCF09686.1 IS110 family transposase [Dictyobacter arantiisoli]